ncbi:MAG: hypothetical protein EBZ89_02005, partial [Chloroflexi bacterium]|nr:hypothetical protein [Chloroflexota bacterium]
RIAKRPAVVDDVVVARSQVTLSLTFDHRIVDGARKPLPPEPDAREVQPRQSRPPQRTL